MTVTPKKVCFLHFSCSPHSSTRPNCLYNLCSKSGQKFGKEFDFAQVRTLFFSGKKPDPENPGKIRIWNFLYLGWDFENGHYKLLFYGEMWIFFCDSHKFWHFWHLNFWLYIHKFLKNQLDIYFLVIWDIFGFIITVLYDNGFFIPRASM